VRDSQQLVKGYSGETRFPLFFQNLHRYFFYAATFLIVPFLWWDVLLAFRFPTGDGRYAFGLGLGTLIMLVNAALLTLYSLSCHSCRHLCGGRLDVLSQSPTRLSMWRTLSHLNENHMQFAWASLISVMLTDMYIRFMSMGYLSDLRIL
jgi:hypothetical protein